MCPIPNLLDDESRSGWSIEKAGIAEVDGRLRNVALTLQGNGLEAEQHSDAQKSGHLDPLGISTWCPHPDILRLLGQTPGLQGKSTSVGHRFFARRKLSRRINAVSSYPSPALSEMPLYSSVRPSTRSTWAAAFSHAALAMISVVFACAR